MVKVRHWLMTANLRCPHQALIKARSGERDMSQDTKDVTEGMAPVYRRNLKL
jgi:hypothetical protein